MCGFWNKPSAPNRAQPGKHYVGVAVTLNCLIVTRQQNSLKISIIGLFLKEHSLVAGAPDCGAGRGPRMDPLPPSLLPRPQSSVPPLPEARNHWTAPSLEINHGSYFSRSDPCPGHKTGTGRHTQAGQKPQRKEKFQFTRNQKRHNRPSQGPGCEVLRADPPESSLHLQGTPRAQGAQRQKSPDVCLKQRGRRCERQLSCWGLADP